mgnify:FL=1
MLEEQYAFNVSEAPKSKILRLVEYTYVTFKSNQAPAEVLRLFQREPTRSKLIRRLLCIEDAVKDSIELED